MGSIKDTTGSAEDVKKGFTRTEAMGIVCQMNFSSKK